MTACRRAFSNPGGWWPGWTSEAALQRRVSLTSGCRLTLAPPSAEKLSAIADELKADVLTIKTDVTARDDLRCMVWLTLDFFGVMTRA